jgi:hypothetical protein
MLPGVKDDARRAVAGVFGVVAVVAATLAAVAASGHPAWLIFCLVVAVVTAIVAVALEVPDMTALMDGRLVSLRMPHRRSAEVVQSVLPRPEPVITNRWLYTAWDSRASGVMDLLGFWMPGANHNQQPTEHLAWVRFIAVVTCGPVGPDVGGKPLWSWLEEFLAKPPITELVAALAAPSDGLSWTRWAASHASTVDAMLTSGAEDEAVASARLDVPDGKGHRIESDRALLMLNFEPPRNGGKPLSALKPVAWEDLIQQAVGIPRLLTEFLSRELDLSLSGEPPVVFAVRLDATSDLAELIDITGLESLPGGRHRTQAVGYFIGSSDGASPVGAARRMVTDVLRYGFSIER